MMERVRQRSGWGSQSEQLKESRNIGIKTTAGAMIRELNVKTC